MCLRPGTEITHSAESHWCRERGLRFAEQALPWGPGLWPRCGSSKVFLLGFHVFCSWAKCEQTEMNLTKALISSRLPSEKWFGTMETGLSILVPALEFFPKSQADFRQVDPRYQIISVDCQGSGSLKMENMAKTSREWLCNQEKRENCLTNQSQCLNPISYNHTAGMAALLRFHNLYYNHRHCKNFKQWKWQGKSRASFSFKRLKLENLPFLTIYQARLPHRPFSFNSTSPSLPQLLCS